MWLLIFRLQEDVRQGEFLYLSSTLWICINKDSIVFCIKEESQVFVTKQQHGSWCPQVVGTSQNTLLLQRFNSTQFAAAMQTDILMWVMCVFKRCACFLEVRLSFNFHTEQKLLLLKPSWSSGILCVCCLMSYVCLWCRNRGGKPRMSVTQFQESEPWRASVSRNRSALSLTGLPSWNWRASRSNMAASAAPVTEPTMQSVWK